MEPTPFNPNEFTEKELVKLIYRDLQRMREEFDEFVKNNTTQREISELRERVIALEADIKIERQLRAETQKEADKKNKVLIGWAGVLVTAVQIAIGFLFRNLKP